MSNAHLPRSPVDQSDLLSAAASGFQLADKRPMVDHVDGVARDKREEKEREGKGAHTIGKKCREREGKMKEVTCGDQLAKEDR